jgi:quercetin dioxygenase-like cupin family protein
MSTTAAEQEHLWFLDALVTIPVAHADGRDGVSVLEATAPQGDSPPLHVHRAEDEIFHVLEGELRLHVGGRDLRLGVGETALAPQGVPHSYRVESPDGARWLVVTTKGGFEQVVRSVARRADRPELPEPTGPPTEEQAGALAAACSACNIDLVGPPLL